MVMDPNTLHALAEIRGRLSQLESALGAQNPDDAEKVVRRLAAIVQTQQQQIAALTAWARTVTPPFTPQKGD